MSKVKNLKEACQDYFDKHKLTDQQMSQLEQLLTQDGRSLENNEKIADTQIGIQGEHKRIDLRRPMLIKLAMVVSVACLCALFYLLPNNSSDLLIDQIAREVAKNHVHLKPLEVTSTEFSKVRSYFKNLDFLPFPSKTLDSSFNMQGGRYCSIQSIAAAQLRYQTESGEIVTIYEVDYQPAKFGKIPHIQTGEKPIQTFALGLSVTLWVENGVMMAKVKKAD